jgi:hypothetical protein
MVHAMPEMLSHLAVEKVIFGPCVLFEKRVKTFKFFFITGSITDCLFNFFPRGFAVGFDITDTITECFFSCIGRKYGALLPVFAQQPILTIPGKINQLHTYSQV